MKLLTCCLPWLLTVSLVAQTQKGASPTPSNVDAGPANNTYAVVIGISDYQNDDIPDLRFADKDAEAFASFLRSPAGGRLDDDHLVLLTNEAATAGQVISALYWLVDETQEGDQAIIYFSGHGDVEGKFRGQPGFLLCWDSPAKVYMAGGVLQLGNLQTVISTLSLDIKAKVTVITDACRSGKLAGSENNGSQLTNANLSQQFANEIKILSCQPDEYSIEGEQWGGGRGAFSYHLIDGLYGMADNNEDLSVNLMEIGRYLEDHVTAEVAPESQIPMVIGGRSEKLTTVFPEILDQLRQEKQGQLDLFTSTESKGIEDEILAQVNTSVRKMYRLFKRSLEDKVFLEPANACADVYYNQLMQEPKLSRLHGSMTRNYAAAMQDDAQQVINNWLNMEGKELGLSPVSQSIKYKLYPSYLERAAELVGPEHYMYKVFQARKLFFEGWLMHLGQGPADNGKKILAKYREALKWDPDLPHVYNSMSIAHFLHLANADSAEYYAHRAVELAPSWALPYTTLAFNYSNWTAIRNLDKTKYFLDLVDQLDSTAAYSNIEYMNTWGNYYNATKQFKKSEEVFKRMIRLDSTYVYAYGNLGISYYQTGQYDKAERLYKKSIGLDSSNPNQLINLGILYNETKRFTEAEALFKRAHKMDPSGLWPLTMLTSLYIRTNRLEKANKQLEKVLARDPGFPPAYLNTAYSFLITRRYYEGEQLLLRAINQDSLNAQYQNELGFVYWKQDRLEEAEQQYLKAISLDSTSGYAYPNLGLVYAKMGRYAEANALFKKGLELDPNNEKNIAVNYAVLYSLQGQPDKAFDYLQKSFQLGYKKEDTHIDLMEDSGLAPLRDQKERWDALIQQYFPDGAKE